MERIVGATPLSDYGVSQLDGDLRIRRYAVARSSRGDGKVEAIRASLNPPAVLFNRETRDMLLGQVFSGSIYDVF
jgi:hypothetical protein